MANAASWVVAHWAMITAAIACTMSVLGTVKNLLADGKHAGAETWLSRVLDVLAWVSKEGAAGLPYLGRMSVPGLPSREVKQ